MFSHDSTVSNPRPTKFPSLRGFALRNWNSNTGPARWLRHARQQRRKNFNYSRLEIQFDFFLFLAIVLGNRLRVKALGGPAAARRACPPAIQSTFGYEPSILTKLQCFPKYWIARATLAS